MRQESGVEYVMSAKSLLVAACLALPIAAVADQLNVKPGLWEIISTSHTSGMPPLPKEMLDRMTPEQRAQMQTAMQEESDKTRTERECITKEDVENPFQSETEGCTQTIATTTRTTQEVRLTCTGDLKGSGVLRITTPTPESMTGVMDLEMGQGSNVLTMKSQYKGRWPGADCGNEGERDYDEDVAEQDTDE
jgi:Protein of unknown function (DUF3617)